VLLGPTPVRQLQFSGKCRHWNGESGVQLEVAGTGGRKVKIIGQSSGLIQIEGDGTSYATGIKFTSGEQIMLRCQVL